MPVEIFTIAHTDDFARDMKLSTKPVRLLIFLMEAEKMSAVSQGEFASYAKLLPIKTYLDEHFAEQIYLTRIFKEQ